MCDLSFGAGQLTNKLKDKGKAKPMLPKLEDSIQFVDPSA
jgi:hypothetical protein